MVASAQTVPHFYLRRTAHADALLRLRAELNDGAAVPVSLNDLVLKAASVAYVRVPEMNVIWTETAIRRFDSVDLGLAVATDDGLVTPVVRSVDAMTISALAARTSDLASRGRAGRLRPDELDGGVATVSNLGMFDAEEFAAIIKPPQSAILAVGAARAEPIAVDGQLAVGNVVRVTLSVDHRPLDGVIASKWMREFVSLLEKPTHILR
jgi:pyruvate dehydrogenase E2 component (dihydrolipoamide acetyltransferase)